MFAGTRGIDGATRNAVLPTVAEAQCISLNRMRGEPSRCRDWKLLIAHASFNDARVRVKIFRQRTHSPTPRGADGRTRPPIELRERRVRNDWHARRLVSNIERRLALGCV